MNLFEIRRRNLELLDQASRIHRGCIRFSHTESREHLNRKAEVCRDLKSDGRQFITEAEFWKDKLRADVVDIDSNPPTVYEIDVTHPTPKLKIDKFKKLGFRVIIIGGKNGNI